MTRTELLDVCKSMPVAEVLSRWGLPYKSNGRGWPCPVCENRNQTHILTRVNPARWECGKCGSKGSSADLWLRLDGLDPDRLEDCWDSLERMAGASVERYEVKPVEATPALMSVAEVNEWWERGRKLQTTADQDAAERWAESRGLETGVPALPWPARLSLANRAPHVDGLRRGGPVLVWPLYSLAEKPELEIVNLMLRPSYKAEGVKAMTLNKGDGTCSDGGYPLSYGRRKRIEEDGYTTLIVVEGGPDWATVLSMDLRAGVLGARCASDLSHGWAGAIRAMPWVADVLVVPHRDKPTERYPLGVGHHESAQLVDQLVAMGIRARLFKWGELLDHVSRERRAGVSDLNDLIRRDRGAPIMSLSELEGLMRGMV